MTMALPASQQPLAGKKPLTTTAIFIASGFVMSIGALIGVYLRLRSEVSTWPAKDVSFDNYMAVMLTVTMLMSYTTAVWAIVADRRGQRRQALAAVWMTFGFGIAFINGLWFLMSELGFGPQDHRYGLAFYALLIVGAANVVVAWVMVGLTGLLSAGHDQLAGSRDRSGAALLYWQFAVVGWIVVYSILYLLK